MKRMLSIFALALTALSTAPAQSQVPWFSIDAASPSAGLVSPADVLAPGGLGGPPVVVIPFVMLGLLPGDDIDAISYVAPFAPPLYFTVDRLAAGAPALPGPNVFTEAGFGQAAGDVYASPGGGFNALAINQSALGLVPPVLPGPPVVPPPIDHVDALDLNHPAVGGPGAVGGLFFSLAAGSPSILPGGPLFGVAGPADILAVGGGVPVIAIPAAALGLVPGDDVDGLQMLSGGPGILFSLAAGSPSLGVLLPGDVLTPGPVPIVAAGALGLGFGLAGPDDLKGIALVPEPQTYAQLTFGLALLGLWVRLRARRAH